MVMARKKWKVLILTAGLWLCLLTGCGDEAEIVAEHAPKVPEVQLIIKTPVMPMENVIAPEQEGMSAYLILHSAVTAFAAQYKDAKVTYQVYQFEQTREDQEVRDCFDTDRAADVLFEGYFNMSTYIHTGRVVPLDDIITEDIRRDIDERFWEISRVDGKTYMMPFFGLQNVLYYNKDLFRQAGLEPYIGDGTEVQSWTLEEWEIVLSALREKLPATSYPMMMYAGDNQGDTHVMTLLRCQGSDFFDGSGRFHLNTPEGIAAMQWIRDCYEKGYFPANAETMVQLDNYALFKSGQLAIYMGNIGLDSLYEEAGLETGKVNFPSLDGTGYNTNFIAGFEVFDNGDEMTVKVAKDFVKFMYETQWLDCSTGGIPVSHKIAEEYGAEMESAVCFVNNAGITVDFTANNPNWRGVREAFYPHIYDLLYGEKPVEQVAKELDAACNAAIDQGYAESKLHE